MRTFFCVVGFQILIVVGWQREQLSLCVPLPLGKRPASEWLRALEYAISYSLASGLTETYASLPTHLKGGVDVLTEQHGTCEVGPATFGFCCLFVCYLFVYYLSFLFACFSWGADALAEEASEPVCAPSHGDALDTGTALSTDLGRTHRAAQTSQVRADCM